MSSYYEQRKANRQLADQFKVGDKLVVKDRINASPVNGMAVTYKRGDIVEITGLTTNSEGEPCFLLKGCPDEHPGYNFDWFDWSIFAMATVVKPRNFSLLDKLKGL